MSTQAGAHTQTHNTRLLSHTCVVRLSVEPTPHAHTCSHNTFLYRVTRSRAHTHARRRAHCLASLMETARERACARQRAHALSRCFTLRELKRSLDASPSEASGPRRLGAAANREQGGASAGREHGMRAVAHTFACVRTRACLGLQVGVLDVSNNVAMPVPHSRPARNHGVGDAHERGRLDLVDAQHTSLLRAVHHHHRPR